jgi:beta-glucosidase
MPNIPALQPAQQTAEWAVPWWMPRHEQKLQELQKADQIDLVMIGDSITHGWDSAGREVWDKYYAPRNALNLGFSGDRTEHVLWRLDHGEIKGLSPKLVVLMIGTNNTGQRQDRAEHTAAGVKAIIDRLHEEMPESKILLLAIFPRDKTKEGAFRKLNKEINGLIGAFADGTHVFFLNVNHIFLDEEGNLPERLMPDLLHPNAEGYALWAEAMEPMVKKLLEETE